MSIVTARSIPSGISNTTPVRVPRKTTERKNAALIFLRDAQPGEKQPRNGAMRQHALALHQTLKFNPFSFGASTSACTSSVIFKSSGRPMVVFASEAG
jgi:hypothetical protein